MSPELETIEFEKKTDRELLILAIQLLNGTCKEVNGLKKWRDGNGTPGAKFQIWVLWAVFVAVLAKLW